MNYSMIDVLAALFYLEAEHDKESTVRDRERLLYFKPRAVQYLRSLPVPSKAERQALMVLEADEMIYVRNGVKLIKDALYAANEDAMQKTKITNET